MKDRLIAPENQAVPAFSGRLSGIISTLVAAFRRIRLRFSLGGVPRIEQFIGDQKHRHHHQAFFTDLPMLLDQLIHFLINIAAELLKPRFLALTTAQSVGSLTNSHWNLSQTVSPRLALHNENASIRGNSCAVLPHD